MASNINVSFEQQWSAEVKQAYQQETQKLRDCVRVQTGVVGETYNFPVLDSIVANTKARGAELTFIDADHNVVPATLEDAYAPLLLDRLDEIKAKADYRREYVQTTAKALARKADDIVVAALDAGVTSGSPASGIITEVAAGAGTIFDSLLTAQRNLNSADVPMNERCFVHAPATLDLALREAEFTSADFMMIKNLVAGEIDTALGFKWVLSTRLTDGGGPRQNYAMHRRAAGLAIGQDVTSEVNYIPERVAHLATSMLSMGATIIDGPGVVRINVTE